MGSCLSVDGSGSLSPYPPTSPRMKLREMRKRNSTEKDEQLQKIPGRMYLNGATKIASIYTQQGKKGINQDAMIVWENFGSRTDTIFCGVFDGHGPFGHVVARKVRDSLPLKLSAHWGVHVGNGNSTTVNVNGVSLPSEQTPFMPVDEQSKPPLEQDKKEKLPEIFTTLKDSFRKACRVMDKELKLHPNIDCFCSGSTAVTLVKQDQDLVIGNLGDSRAVLGTRDEDNTLLAVQLTVDLKPNVPREAERIKRCKGRVFALRDEPEVARVWLPNHDTPGLAMARAFGDFCLKDFGLISVPEVTYRRLTERDEFVVLATDGIWDVLSNKDVVEIVAAAPSRKLAARFLVDTAVRSWRMKYPTSKVDDCAVVCLFFDDNGKSEADFKTDDSVVESLAAACTISSPESDQHSNPDLATGSPTTKKAKPMRSLSRQVSPEEEETQTASGDWSAIEGVTRVNTLLALPRLDVKQDTK